jgi:hypothetical protein
LSATATDKASVVDLGPRRREVIQSERRHNRRTILTNLLGAFTVVPEQGLKEIFLYDISEGGLAFDCESDGSHFKVGEEIAVRVYISREIYVPVTVVVKNVREIRDEGVYRHGTTFSSQGTGDEVLKHFVKFVEAMSVNLRRDHGDLKLSTQKS